MLKRLFRKVLLLLVGAFAIAIGITLFNTTNATTTFHYAVTELESLSSKESGAYGINDRGQIVGKGKKDGQTKAALHYLVCQTIS